MNILYKNLLRFHLTVFSSVNDLDLRNIRLQVVNLETGRLERIAKANNQGEVSLEPSLMNL